MNGTRKCVELNGSIKMQFSFNIICAQVSQVVAFHEMLD